MYSSVKKPEKFFIVINKTSEDGCSLICGRFLPQKHSEWRDMFFIVIDALFLHDFLR